MTRPALDDALLRRFARQVVLPEVGEAGQRRLLDLVVLLSGTGPVAEAAAVYLAAAGVGRLLLHDPRPVGAAAGRFPFPPAPPETRRDAALATALGDRAAGRVLSCDEAARDPRADAANGACRIVPENGPLGLGRLDALLLAGGGLPPHVPDPRTVPLRLAAVGGPGEGGRVVAWDAEPAAGTDGGPRPLPEGGAALALGALLADAALRPSAGVPAPSAGFEVLAGGTVRPGD